MDNSSSYLLKKLLANYSIKIDEKELEFQLESHPSYPSLHALTGVLTHFGISNIAVEVPRTVETFSSLPKSFIAHIKIEEEENFVLATHTENHIEIIYNKKEKETLSLDVFLRHWTGILLAVEKNEEEIQVKRKARSGKLIYYLAAICFVSLFFWGRPDLFQSVHFALSLIGIAIAMLIVQHELGLSSKVLDKFCTGNSKNTSCKDVLSSKGAQLFGFIKFSDIGLIYFGGISLSWLLLSLVENSNENLIILLTASAIPFTFYSVYYQYFVVKKWCPLCLSVLAVLIGQAFSLFLTPIDIHSLAMDTNSNLLVGNSLIVIISLWIFVYPKLKSEQEHRQLKIRHNRFKNNYDIFRSLILTKPLIETTIEKSSEIVLGTKNDQAALKLVLITNPLCGHCRNAHHTIDQLLKTNTDNLQVRIRFNVNTKDKNSLDTKIALRVLNIYHTEKEEHTIQALHEIYSGTDIDAWFKKWDMDDNPKYSDEMEIEKEWCMNNDINFTPLLLVNGRPFPNEYENGELLNFVEDIIEDEIQKQEASNMEVELSN